MQPPIPSPEATCPHCGQLIGTSRAKYCPHCGAAIQTSSSSVSGLKIFGAICLGLLAMPLGSAGACFLVIGGASTLQSGASGEQWAFVGIGFGCVLVAALLVWGIIKLLKR